MMKKPNRFAIMAITALRAMAPLAIAPTASPDPRYQNAPRNSAQAERLENRRAPCTPRAPPHPPAQPPCATLPGSPGAPPCPPGATPGQPSRATLPGRPPVKPPRRSP